MPSPENPKRQIWVLDGENLGSKFPSPDEQESEAHLKRFGRDVGTPVAARELSNVTQRLRHMDELGIDVQVLFNSLWITPLTRRADAEIALSWAWNRWLADVWKMGDDRLRWTCVVPALSPKEAVAQIRFAKEHGAVGVCMRPFERDRMMTDPFYYPIYEEAQRLDIPVTVHLATAAGTFQTHDQRSRRRLLDLPRADGNLVLRVDHERDPQVFPNCAGVSSRCRVNGCPG
jgi:predicted TIM-barrel fold metal-dependent hydrolase